MSARETRCCVPYRGVLIHRNTEPGHRLRWWAFSPNGGQLAADTLAGIKALIRAETIERKGRS